MPLVIGGIAVVFVGLIAMLLYYGLTAMGKVIIRWTPGDLPVIGNFLKDAVTVLVNIAEDGIRAILLPIVHAAEELIGAIGAWIVRIIGGLLDLGHVAAIALLRIVTVHIPAAIIRLIHFTQAMVYAVKAELGARIGQLRADVHGWLNDVRGWVTTLVSAAVAELSTRLHQLRADTFGALDNLASWTRALVASTAAALGHELAALREWTSQHILRVEADLSNAVHGLEADIATGVGVAEHQAARMVHDLSAAVATGVIAVDIPGVPELVSGLIDDVGGLVGVIGSDLPQLGDLVKGLDLSGALDLAGITVGALTLERVLTRYLRDCGVPNCRNLSSLGRFLESLLGAAGMGLLLELILAMIHDPEQAARDVIDDLAPILDVGKSLASDLLGV